MKLEGLEKRHGDFFVPTAVVMIGRDDLVRDLYLTVSSIKVDLQERAAGHFSITVVNAFDWEAREFVADEAERRVDLLDLFAFGTKVEISFGYGDAAKVKQHPLFNGIITELTTSFDEGAAPSLQISGYDALYSLTVGTTHREWEKTTDSDAVKKVIQERKLRGTVASTTPSHDSTTQFNETDMRFVERLAERNGMTFLVKDDRFYFGPRRNKEDPVAELLWGQGLLSFRPEVNLAGQVSEVEVVGWSVTKAEPIVGTAKRGDETGRDVRAKSGGDRVAKAVGAAPSLSIRAAVRDKAAADALAKATLEERAQTFVSGTGASVGLPEIVPDTNLKLGGLGRGFSKTYYVSGAVHTFDSSGYRTSFSVQETTI